MTMAAPTALWVLGGPCGNHGRGVGVLKTITRSDRLEDAPAMNEDADRSTPDGARSPDAPQERQAVPRQQRVDVRRRLMALRRW